MSQEDKEFARKVRAGALAQVRDLGWLEGYRNNVTVDYGLACSVLGIAYGEAANAMEDVIEAHGLETERKASNVEEDIDDFRTRLDKVFEYVNGWRDNPDWYYLDAETLATYKPTFG